MAFSVTLYEDLIAAGEDRSRAKIIATAFERLEERYPHLPDLATQAHVTKAADGIRDELRQSELRLHKEIAEVRQDTEAIRAGLEKETALIRQDTEAIRGELAKECQAIRAELEKETALIRQDTEAIRAELAKESQAIRAELEKQTAQIRGDMDRRIAEAQTATIKWVAGLLVVQAAALTGVIATLG